MTTSLRAYIPFSIYYFEEFGDGWFRLTGDHANPNWKMILQYEE